MVNNHIQYHKTARLVGPTSNRHRSDITSVGQISTRCQSDQSRSGMQKNIQSTPDITWKYITIIFTIDVPLLAREDKVWVIRWEFKHWHVEILPSYGHYICGSAPSRCITITSPKHLVRCLIIFKDWWYSCNRAGLNIVLTMSCQ